MSLSLRIFLVLLLLIGLSIGFILDSVTTELVPGMRQSLEEVLVDTANLLAEIVETEVADGSIAEGDFANSMSTFSLRRVNASISSLQKNDSNLMVYITDDKGRVIYDSTGINLGKDYSRWNDVYLTLRGDYGSRTTRKDKKDSTSSVMYVAAPIKNNNQIIGVLSVGKPSASVQPYFEKALATIQTKVAVLALGALLIVVLFVYWITLSIRRLTHYAKNVQQGERTKVPLLREKELAQLANAMEEMRVSLEGKNYVENYLHSLTHELKSPLAAIQGAADLLQEDMPEETRQRFVNNIANESRRLRQIVERLLKLAAVEKRQQLQDVEAIDAGLLTLQLCEDKAPMLEQKHLKINQQITPGTLLMAEQFLVQQAISNLLDNAIEFSAQNGEIIVSTEVDENEWHCHIRDFGPGIPDYAQDNIFDRFYSLPRPDHGKKSTGLGLSLVREVALLHTGRIQVVNCADGGAESILTLPLKQK